MLAAPPASSTLKRCRTVSHEDCARVHMPRCSPSRPSAPAVASCEEAISRNDQETAGSTLLRPSSSVVPDRFPCNNLEELDRQCQELAEIIRHAKHLVAFTGAGISTSVGIPDYRGEHGIRTSKQARKGSKKAQSDIVIPDFHHLVPSRTHIALVELHRLGYLQYVVSQNVDNLHRKSGLPAAALTEVHGNATHARCETCEKIYTDAFPHTGLCMDPACKSTTRSIPQRLRARTRHGNGRLKRHVIGFDEPLDDIDHAIEECEAADVALVLGTSLRVEPFSEMAGAYAKKLAIVNLQPTTAKLDKRAEGTGVRIYEKCDIVMEKVMHYLLGAPYTIPSWTGSHPTSVFIPEHEDSNLVNVLAGRIVHHS